MQRTAAYLACGGKVGPAHRSSQTKKMHSHSRKWGFTENAPSSDALWCWCVQSNPRAASTKPTSSIGRILISVPNCSFTSSLIFRPSKRGQIATAGETCGLHITRLAICVPLATARVAPYLCGSTPQSLRTNRFGTTFYETDELLQPCHKNHEGIPVPSGTIRTIATTGDSERRRIRPQSNCPDKFHHIHAILLPKCDPRIPCSLAQRSLPRVLLSYWILPCSLASATRLTSELNVGSSKYEF